MITDHYQAVNNAVKPDYGRPNFQNVTCICAHEILHSSDLHVELSLVHAANRKYMHMVPKIMHQQAKWKLHIQRINVISCTKISTLLLKWAWS